MPRFAETQLPVVCEGCLRVWLPGDRDRWQAYWIDDESEVKLVFRCAQCG